MTVTNWQPEHEAALESHMAIAGRPFSQIAELLNNEFGTAYTRNSVIGKAGRLGLKSLNPSGVNIMEGRPRKPRKLRERRVIKIERANIFGSLRIRETKEVAEQYKLRCVEIKCLVPFADKTGCCYTDSDGLPYLFCDGPKQEGSSYCTPHFHLTRQEPKPFLDKAMKRFAA